jgi:hypothetical protein
MTKSPRKTESYGQIVDVFTSAGRRQAMVWDIGERIKRTYHQEPAEDDLKPGDLVRFALRPGHQGDERVTELALVTALPPNLTPLF